MYAPCLHKSTSVMLMHVALVAALVLPGRAFYICAIPAGNSVVCDQSQPASEYTGMEIEMIRYIATAMNLPEYDPRTYNHSNDIATDMTTYAFWCSSDLFWVQMMEAMVVNTTFNHCAMATGEITITPARMASGVRFSYPYMGTGLAIMIYSNPHNVDKWAFFKPYAPRTWYIYIVTLLFVPMLIWFVEQLCMHGYIVLSLDTLNDMRQATYETMLCIFNLQIFKVKSWAAQMSVLCFCLLVLIMMSTYVAQLAAVLTTTTIGASIKSIEDLRGLQFRCQDIYTSQLKQVYGVEAIPMGFEPDTFKQMADMLEAGTSMAYIADALDQQAGVASDNRACHLSLLPDHIIPHDYGFSYHILFPDDLMNRINYQVLVAQANGAIEQFTNRFLVFPDSCSGIGSNQIGGITFQQMSGLWIILGAGLGLSFLIAAWTLARQVYRHMRGLDLDDDDMADLFENSNNMSNQLSGKVSNKSLSQAISRVFVKEPLKPGESLRSQLSLNPSVSRGHRSGRYDTNTSVSSRQFADPSSHGGHSKGGGDPSQYGSSHGGGGAVQTGQRDVSHHSPFKRYNSVKPEPNGGVAGAAEGRPVSPARAAAVPLAGPTIDIVHPYIPEDPSVPQKSSPF